MRPCGRVPVCGAGSGLVLVPHPGPHPKGREVLRRYCVKQVECLKLVLRHLGFLFRIVFGLVRMLSCIIRGTLACNIQVLPG